METDIFEKRLGTTDRGKDYEDVIIANLIIQLVENENIKDFKLSSNDKNFGAFDDVVLEVESADGCNENYALQLKHSEGNKILTEQSLQGEKGDFSIQKYLKNVLELKSNPSKTINYTNFKWILLTNRRFDNKHGKKIKFEKEDFEVEILECSSQSLLAKTFKNGKCYKFKLDPQVTRKEYCEFFNNFFLYTNQPNVDDVKTEISNKFQEIFCCEKNIFGEYLTFIAEWSVREGKKVKLNKKCMKHSIGLRLLSPFIQPLSTTTSDVTETRTILQDAISKFNITILEQQNKEKITEMFGDAQKEFSKTDTSAINKTGKKFQVISSYVKKVEDLDKMEYTRLLWLMDKCPLIVLDNNSLSKAMNLCADKNFIVLSDGASKNFTDVSVFRNLSDLKSIDENIYYKILENFMCSLQGKETVSLQDLIESNNEIEAIITPNTLFSMLDSPFVIGENEKLPLPYVNRMLSKHLIHWRSLQNLPEDTAVIITGAGANGNLEPLRSFWNMLDLEQLTEDLSKGFEQFEKAVMFYISYYEVSQQKFTTACSQIRKRNPNKKKFHQFRVFNSEMFEWTRSSGSINDLQKSIVTHFVSEEELYNCENNINILCDNPGMGKTTLMKNVKNTTAPLFWTVLVYPKDHTNFFCKGRPNPDLFTEYLLNKYKIQLKTFESKLLEVLFKHNQIVYIWDGLDEVSEKNLKTVLDIIDNLSKKGIKQWVTSRNNLKEMLEEKFNVFSRTTQQFSEIEQKRYMRNRLDFSLHKKIGRMEFFKNCEILSNPLHIFIFTELLLQNPSKYKELLNNKIFSITDLLGYFVDEKFNIYHRKERADEVNNITSERNEWFKNEHIMFYEKAAMKTYFEQSILQETNIHFEELSNECKKKRKDPVGIITDISEENVNFAHNSYGEYFAALYLSENLCILSKFANFFFRERYRSIRFMFDSILAEGCRAHLAVLYRDFEALRNCDEDELKICDGGGRNAFQLACSYGRNYSEITSKKVGLFLKKYFLIEDKKDQVEREDNVYNDILRYLVEKCDIGIKDKIFNLDSLEYADKASCLLPQAVLLSKNKLKDLQKVDVPKILYYSVIIDRPEVFDSIQQIPYVYRYPDNSLLHLSAEKGSVNCFKKLIGSNTYGSIFKKLHEQTNLLFIAHIYNQPKIYQVLKELGVADFCIGLYNRVTGNQPGRFHSFQFCCGSTLVCGRTIEKFIVYLWSINFYKATGRRLEDYGNFI